MSTRLIMLLISVGCLIFIVSLSRSIFSLWQKGSVISEREAIRQERDHENQQLKQKLGYVQSPDFIKRQARDKLNLAREGERVVVLPQQVQKTPISAPAQASSPPWSQWWHLFF